MYFLADSLYFKQNGQNYYRSYENLLFFTSPNRCSLFNSINFIIIAFYVIDMLYVLSEHNISEAINKFFACGIVICFDIYRWAQFGDGLRCATACVCNFLIDLFRFGFVRYRLEYFSVMFNILLALIYLFTDGLRLICWHIPEKNARSLRVCVTLKLLLWTFVFLILLPVKFLMPTLFGRKFYLWLNSFFLLWYGSCVWNSVSQILFGIVYLVYSRAGFCWFFGFFEHFILADSSVHVSSNLPHQQHFERLYGGQISIKVWKWQQKKSASTTSQ